MISQRSNFYTVCNTSRQGSEEKLEYCTLDLSFLFAVTNFRIIFLIYHFTWVICVYISRYVDNSSKLTVSFELRSRKIVCISEQIMSLNKYPCIFSRQMEATVSINLIIFLQRAGKIFTINLLLFFFLRVGCLLCIVLWYGFMNKQTYHLYSNKS